MNILTVVFFGVLSIQMVHAQNHCYVPDGPIRATVQYRGQRVVAQDGALVIGQTIFTRCNGLMGAYPTSLAVVKGSVYIGFRSGALMRYDGGSLTQVTQASEGEAIRSLAAWRETLYVGTSHGLKRLVKGRLNKTHHRILSRRAITAMAVDVRGRLHIAAGPYGWWIKRSAQLARRHKKGFVGCFEVAGRRIRGRTPGRTCDLGRLTASGLPSAHVSALAIHQGTLFVGHFDGGIARQVTADKFEVITQSPRFVNGMISDGKTLWIATARGLFATDDGLYVYQPSIALPSDHINGVAVGLDGVVWVATSKGVVAIDDNSVRLVDQKAGLVGRIAYTVQVDHLGNVWVGTERGAVVLTATGIRHFSHLKGQLPHDWVTAIVAHEDCVYLGTYDAGVVKACADGYSEPVELLSKAWVNPHGLFMHQQRLFVSTLGTGLKMAFKDEVVTLSGLPHDDVTGIIRHKDTFWIATRGGLASVSIDDIMGPDFLKPKAMNGTKSQFSRTTTQEKISSLKL